MKKIEIDCETADRITVANLSMHRKWLKKEIATVKQRIEDGTSYPAQAEDLGHNIRLMAAMTTVLQYYGKS